MPRYRVTEHQTGWQTLENFVDAKDEDDAHEKYNESEYVNNEWKVIDEEYFKLIIRKNYGIFIIWLGLAMTTFSIYPRIRNE